jgi:DNA-binding MarR family transcriptional regulator
MQLPADAPLSDHVAVLIGQMSRAVARGRGPLSRAEYTVIARLDLSGPCRLGELTGADGPDPSSVSRRVSALAARGLVERTPDPQDGRAQHVGLTARGRELLHAERLRRADIVTDALADWPETDRSDLSRLLVKLSGSLVERDIPSVERTPA